MQNQFSLEKQYQLYLERVGLNERTMHPTQRIETKRAFFGACGQMLILMRDEIGALSEEDAIKEMQGLLNQVQDYFQQETNRKN